MNTISKATINILASNLITALLFNLHSKSVQGVTVYIDHAKILRQYTLINKLYLYFLYKLFDTLKQFTEEENFRITLFSGYLFEFEELKSRLLVDNIDVFELISLMFSFDTLSIGLSLHYVTGIMSSIDRVEGNLIDLRWNKIVTTYPIPDAVYDTIKSKSFDGFCVNFINMLDRTNNEIR